MPDRTKPRVLVQEGRQRVLKRALRTQSAYRWQTDTFIQGLEAQAYRRRLGILAGTGSSGAPVFGADRLIRSPGATAVTSAPYAASPIKDVPPSWRQPLPTLKHSSSTRWGDLIGQRDF